MAARYDTLKTMLRRVRLTNLLSFKESLVELGPLNLLIGANASGKSNLISCIGLMKAAPSDLNRAIVQGGGVREWIWKGRAASSPVARIQCDFGLRGVSEEFQYSLEFAEESRGLSVQNETLDISQSDGVVVHLLSRIGGRVELVSGLQAPGTIPAVAPSASALATFLTPLAPEPVRVLAREFDSISLYREFNTGPRSAARWGVSANIPGEALVEGGDNLAMVLNRMDVTDSIAGINAYLHRFSEHFHDVKVSTKENIVQLLLKETGLSERVTGIRLSDGTLKFLCLLVVLLQKDPPPLICIEEPEIGLHPDAVQLVAELLVEASERTQLVVTTHSEALVDAMSSHPEHVIICERDFDWSTQFKRLKHDDLRTWLERYKLGQLWRLGEIGGTR